MSVFLERCMVMIDTPQIFWRAELERPLVGESRGPPGANPESCG